MKHAYRARKVAAEVTGPVPAEEYRALRAEKECVYCGGPNESVDHIRPPIRGGWEIGWNLVPCCGFCNSSKGDKLLTEWAEWMPERVERARRHSPKVAAEWNRLAADAVGDSA